MIIYESALFKLKKTKNQKNPLQQQTLNFQKTWKDRICVGLLSSIQAVFCSNTTNHSTCYVSSARIPSWKVSIRNSHST